MYNRFRLVVQFTKPSTEEWFVYMLRCAGGSLYTGIAKDVIRRRQ
jgi:predicted GIY-YIG superfamily endonuclease